MKYNYDRTAAADFDEGMGKELADLMKKKWRGVKFNPKTGEGSVNLGLIQVKFNGGSNEDKVYIEGTIKKFRVMSTAQEALQVLLKIEKAISDASG